jgi:selenocysteine-specific elongation factor
MPIHLILGTAGHIDHGKTALVRALTGIDTDRLPEEKKRGITIDLGFAELPLGDYRLGIVDVPGHERFVRNMLAGATGIDLAMLVIAADDSVKQQTREHLEILKLLDLTGGVIALTKCDAAEADWIDLVEAEVRDLVQGTFLAEAPIVRTSAMSGQGIDELKVQLEAAAGLQYAGSDNRGSGPFRMAVDGVFSLPGHGTVVRGSVLRGGVQLGAELQVFPGNCLARVRSLQNHGRDAQRIERGQRAAINLAGIPHDQISRGSELASPGLLRPSRLMAVELSLLSSARRPLKHRQRIRLHLGTTEVLARVLLPDAEEIQPGKTAVAQLLLEKPATTTWGQPFVVRCESPLFTIGGGRVLAPITWKFRSTAREDWEQVENLRTTDILKRAAAAIYFFRWDNWDATDLTRGAAVDQPEEIIKQLVAEEGILEQFSLSPTRSLWIHHRQVAQLGNAIVMALQKLHEENPRDLTIPESRLISRFRYLGDNTLLKAVLNSLVEKELLCVTARGVALPGQGPQLSKKENQLLGQIVETYRQAGCCPPAIEEIKQQTTHNREAVPQLVELAEAQGELVRLNKSFWLHTDVEQQLKNNLRENYSDEAGFTVSQLREQLKISRKYAIPICEYLDRVGFTHRQGDLRVLVEKNED